MQLRLLAGSHEACGRDCCCKTKAMIIVYLPIFHLLHESTLPALVEFTEQIYALESSLKRQSKSESVANVSLLAFS